MKRLLCIIIAICLIPMFAVSEDIYALIDAMSTEELTALQEYVTSKLNAASESNITSLTAKDILVKLEDAGFPVYDRVDYTEETDLNKQLGRPGMYTSKSNAYEKRVDSSDPDPSAIKVEVFKNSEDCQERYNYIDSLGTLASEYMYKEANVLLRVSYDLLPSEASEYEVALKAILNGEKAETSYVPKVKGDSNEIAFVLDENDTSESSRKEPVLIGERYVFDNVAAITVLHAFQGKMGNAIAKAFDRYNVSSYNMENTEEWVMALIKIEGFEDLKDTVYCSSGNFNVVSTDGMKLSDDYSYMSGNPREIGDIPPDSVQYCWFGAPIAKNSDAVLRYDNYDLGEAWFSLSERKILDTSNEQFKEIQKKDEGLEVVRMQCALIEYGFRSKSPSGVFDSDTINALKKFETAAGLKADGVADLETLRRLFSNEPLN